MRTRMSRRHSPPASLISSPRCRFSAAEKAMPSQWERHTRPRTSTPRRAASANTFPISVSEVPARRSSGSPRQSANISRSPSRICATRWFRSAKYVAPWTSGSTRLPSVQAMSPRWRVSSRVEGFPRSREVRNHWVVGILDPFPLFRLCNPCGLRRSQHRGNRTRPSVLVEGVLDLLAGLFEVAIGLVDLAFMFHLLVIGRLAKLLLGCALRLVLVVLQLVGPAHHRAPLLVRSIKGVWGQVGRSSTPAVGGIHQYGETPSVWRTPVSSSACDRRRRDPWSPAPTGSLQSPTG